MIVRRPPRLDSAVALRLCTLVPLRVVPLCVLAILFFAAPLFALPPDRTISQYVHRSWTVEQGLPHNSVRGVTQTSDGSLWIATYEGLVRFNGDDFRTFDKTTSAVISSNSIVTLCRDRDDALWLGTLAGVVRYKSGTFDAIRPEKQQISHSLACADDGSVWVGTAKGTLMHVTGAKSSLIPLPPPVRPLIAVAATGDTVWVGTSSGLLRYHGGKVETLTTANGLASDSIISLLAEGPSLLVGTANGADRIDHGTIVHIAGLPSDQVTALHRDHDGNLWVGTYSNGLYRIHGEQVAAYGIADGLLNPTVRAIFEDREGSLWIGTNGGLEQFRSGAFINWSKRDGLDDAVTRAVYQDHHGEIWVGTARGLNRWNGTSWVKDGDPKIVSVLAIMEGRDGTRWYGTANGLFRLRTDGTLTLFTTANGLASNAIRAVHEDRRGDIWIATDFGLNRLRTDGVMESFAGRGGLTTDYAMAIGESGDGRVWVATGAGLGEWDGRAFHLHSLPSNRLLAMKVDDDGTIWLGTDVDGLERFRNGSTKVITTRSGLPNDKVLSIVEDAHGNLWFGTVRGAFVASKQSLNAVADGKSNQVDATLFDENDGLGSRQCNGVADPAALRTRDGRIWFVTANGVSALAGAWSAPAPLGRPVLERVMVDGKEIRPEALRTLAPGAERIEIRFSGATLVTPDRLHFRYRLDGYDGNWIDAGVVRVASYTRVPPGSYRFQLASSRDGVHWRSVSIPFVLQPHFYQTKWFLALCIGMVAAALLALHSMRLRLARERAQLLQRLVEERTRQISEEKERTVFALKAAEEATADAKRHEALTEKALAQAEEANRTKSIFLATTSHELRTPLNAIIGFSQILIEHDEERLDPRHGRFLHNIHSSGQYLLGIINNILDLSKIEAGRIDLQPEAMLVGEVIQGICSVMRGVAAQRKIHLELDVPEELPLEADPTQFKQVLYNLMSNAVKFSPECGTVTITARAVAAKESLICVDSVELRVVDRGAGIDPHDHQVIFQEFRQARGSRGERPPGTGLGLAVVKRFVEMHHGTIRVESELGAGSCFIVLLPALQSAMVPHLRDARSFESTP